jgi:prepilin-type N-terminal cleavage/methylation domain-containing protein
MIHFTNKRGFSLMETIVVISIISVASGIMLPVLVGGKKSAHRTDDISKLRQLGQAAAMYEAQYNEFPLSTRELVSAGMIPAAMCSSKMDITEKGIGNELATFTNRKMPTYAQIPETPYKNSFIGLGDFGMPHQVMDEYVLTGPGAGWLVDATESEKTEWPTPTQWKGTYRRLTTEGAVITRKHQDYDCFSDGDRKPCRMSVLLFVDPNPYFEELQKSHDQQSSRQ